MGSKTPQSFGRALRNKRVEKGFSLCKFAALIGVSPTYLSHVEQGNITPPTAERVRWIAELLGENADEWIARAGRLLGIRTGSFNSNRYGCRSCFGRPRG